MRFGFVARDISRQGFGVTTFVQKLYAALGSTSFDDELFFFTSSDRALPFPVGPNCREISLGPKIATNFERLYWDHVSIPRASRKHNIDVLLFPYHVRSLYLPCQSVTCIHDLMYHLFPNQWSVLERSYMRWGVNHTVNTTDAIIVPSESTKRDALQLFPHISEKVHVVPYGCSEEFRKLSVEEFEPIVKSYGLRNPYIIYLGSNHPRKNAKMAREIFRDLSASLPHSFVMIGPDYGKTRSMTDSRVERAASDRIYYRGLVPEQHLIALLNGADALLFPSSYEGFGFPVLEAMACGCPVVCFGTSSLPEIVGDAALVVPTGDKLALQEALLQILQNESLRQELAKRGVERAQIFNWDIASKAILAVMRSVCKS